MMVASIIDCPQCGTRTVPAGPRPPACPACDCPFDLSEAT